MKTPCPPSTGQRGSHTGTLGRSGRRGSGKGHPGEDLPDDTKKGYPTITIAVTSIALVLIQSDNVCVAHILRDVSFLSATADQLV